MRMYVLALTALVTCGALSARAAEPATNTTEPAAAAQPPAAVSEPEATPKPAAPAAETARAASESKADKQPAAPSGARYGFERVDGGYLRLDYQSGHLSYCMPRSEGWGCQAVPEDRAALEKDIQRLTAENAELKSRLSDLESRLKGLEDEPRPPKPIPPETTPDAPKQPSGSGDQTFSVPGREHIARAASAVQSAWRHLVEMVTTLKNDVLRRTGA
jgi:hypothetical protein